MGFLKVEGGDEGEVMFFEGPFACDNVDGGGGRREGVKLLDG